MENSLKPHINENCKIFMPEGLEELMYDISREVVRTKPANLYKFITDYLATLLIVRENLSVAFRLSEDLCSSVCQPELQHELLDIGLSLNDAIKANKIIEEYFDGDEHKESNLLIKLLKKTSISETQVPLVQEAVRTAYLKHQANRKIVYQSSDSDEDEVKAAIRHTLKLYRDTQSTDREYHQKAAEIQAAYRAYSVRRKLRSNDNQSSTSSNISISTNSITNTAKPSQSQGKEEMETEDVFESKKERGIGSASSLADSYVSLPKYQPYIVNSIEKVGEENKEENAVINYTAETPLIAPPVNNTASKTFDDNLNETTVPNNNDEENDDDKKTSISFNEISRKINNSVMSESIDETIEEVLLNDLEDYDEIEECIEE